MDIGNLAGKVIMFYPDAVDERKQSRVYRMLESLEGISYHNNPAMPHDIHFFWSYTGHSITPDKTTLDAPDVINKGCWDISKEKVGRIFDDIFVDPETHQGVCVEKYNRQGQHKHHGLIMCPATRRKDYVYQRYIENKDERGYYSFRIHYALGIKMIDKRYKKGAFESAHSRDVVNIRDYFSIQDERLLIKKCNEFGFHYGEIDFLMDRGKPVIIDVNNVVGGSTTRDKKNIEHDKKRTKIFTDFLMEWMYESRFNGRGSKVAVDKSWVQNINKEDTFAKKRFGYNISWLYGNVLDVGSADGYGAYLMTKNAKIKTITGVEIQDEAIRQARENLKGLQGITIVKGIGESLPFRDNHFDSVHCGATLEHVDDDERVVKEIHRVAKDIAMFSVPILGGVNRQHVREYKSAEEFTSLIKKHFDIVDVKKLQKKKHKGTGRMSVCVVAKKHNK